MELYDEETARHNFSFGCSTTAGTDDGNVLVAGVSPVVMIMLLTDGIRRHLPQWVRTLLVIVTVGMVLAAGLFFLWSLGPSEEEFGREQFQKFCNAVTRNEKLDRVVKWSRDILSQPDRREPLTKGWMDTKDIPKEVTDLYPSIDGFPIVGVCRQQGTDELYVNISYSVTRDVSCHLFIGSTNLVLQPERVSEVRKWKDGVFLVMVNSFNPKVK